MESKLVWVLGAFLFVSLLLPPAFARVIVQSNTKGAVYNKTWNNSGTINYSIDLNSDSTGKTVYYGLGRPGYIYDGAGSKDYAVPYQGSSNSLHIYDLAHSSDTATGWVVDSAIGSGNSTHFWYANGETLALYDIRANTQSFAYTNLLWDTGGDKEVGGLGALSGMGYSGETFVGAVDYPLAVVNVTLGGTPSPVLARINTTAGGTANDTVRFYYRLAGANLPGLPAGMYPSQDIGREIDRGTGCGRIIPFTVHGNLYLFHTDYCSPLDNAYPSDSMDWGALSLGGLNLPFTAEDRYYVSLIEENVTSVAGPVNWDVGEDANDDLIIGAYGPEYTQAGMRKLDISDCKGQGSPSTRCSVDMGVNVHSPNGIGHSGVPDSTGNAPTPSVSYKAADGTAKVLSRNKIVNSYTSETIGIPGPYTGVWQSFSQPSSYSFDFTSQVDGSFYDVTGRTSDISDLHHSRLIYFTTSEDISPYVDQGKDLVVNYDSRSPSLSTAFFKNYDFEVMDTDDDDAAYWIQNDMLRFETQSHSGYASMKLTASLGGVEMGYEKAIPENSGVNITFYANATGDFNVTLRDTSNGVELDSWTGVSATSGWGLKKLSTGSLADKSGDSLSLKIQFEKGSELYVDDVSLSGENQLPVADANGPYSASTGQEITFDGSGSHDPDGNIVSYEWSFDSTSATGETVTHAYDTNGTYDVTLTVTDNSGATATDTTTADISAGVDAEILNVFMVKSGSDCNFYRRINNVTSGQQVRVCVDFKNTGKLNYNYTIGVSIGSSEGNVWVNEKYYQDGRGSWVFHSLDPESRVVVHREMKIPEPAINFFEVNQSYDIISTIRPSPAEPPYDTYLANDTIFVKSSVTTGVGKVGGALDRFIGMMGTVVNNYVLTSPARRMGFQAFLTVVFVAAFSFFAGPFGGALGFTFSQSLGYYFGFVPGFVGILLTVLGAFAVVYLGRQMVMGPR